MLGALPIFDFDATEAFSAEVFASRLDTPSDVDTILILENRSGASPVFAALHDDLDADNGITDSRIDFTPPAPGNYRLILDYYGIFGPDRSYELELRGGGTPPPPTGGLVINEVDYENPGTDNAEFVEIFNASNAAISLATVSLIFINGANDTEYRRVDLGSAGSSLAAGDYLVIAMNGVTVAPSALVIRDTATAQNGPDGVVLFDTASNTVLDAFSYEGEITAAMITGATGTFDLVEGTASTLADSDTTDETIARCPNGSDTGDADADWSISTTPTAGAANDCN